MFHSYLFQFAYLQHKNDILDRYFFELCLNIKRLYPMGVGVTQLLTFCSSFDMNKLILWGWG
jgi:hypothetical protein